MYKVVRKFQDKDGRIYKIGDDFPSKDAKKPTNARLKTLSTTNNAYGHIYIQKLPPDEG